MINRRDFTKAASLGLASISSILGFNKVLATESMAAAPAKTLEIEIKPNIEEKDIKIAEATPVWDCHNYYSRGDILNLPIQDEVRIGDLIWYSNQDKHYYSDTRNFDIEESVLVGVAISNWDHSGVGFTEVILS